MLKQRQNKQNFKHHKEATDDDQKYELILNGKKMQEERHPYGKSRQIRRQKMVPTTYDQQNYIEKERKSLGSAVNTPKYISKTEKSEGNRKRSQLYDIESFKIEESNVDNRFSTIKRNNKDNGSQMTKKQLILEKDEIYLQQDRKDVKREYVTVEDQTLEKHIMYEKKENVQSSGNGNLELNDGWMYKGEYIRGMFHGYGELYHLNKLIYSGRFQYGFFEGHGKLQYHPIFDRLINSKSITQRIIKHAKKHNKTIQDMDFKYSWLAYFGEFSKGCVTGFGQLWVNTGQKIISKWESGKLIKKCSTVQEGTIN